MKLLHTPPSASVTFPNARALRTLASSMLALVFVLAAKSGWLEGLPW